MSGAHHHHGHGHSHSHGHSHGHSHEGGPNKDKLAVALSSVFASLLMTVGKLVVGLMTGSLGILSEAAHSLLDMGAAALTYFAVRVSDQPADERHPYGHGKIESVSALAETALLFVTGGFIIYEAVQRLLGHDDHPVEVTWPAVAVIVASILIDFGRARALMKVAKETRSQALEADALHFSSDILSSLVVLGGLGLTWLGYPKADAIAAIGVSLFICHVGYDMGKRTLDVLLDAAPDGIADKVEVLCRKVEGVVRVSEVRARLAGSRVFVEIAVGVGRGLSLDQTEILCRAVADAVTTAMPEVVPTVRAEPLALDTETIIDVVRVHAARRGLLIHDLGVHRLGQRMHVGFDIEVDENINIQAAHDIATELEQGLLAELGPEVVIDIHIDPRRFDIVEGLPVEEPRLGQLRQDITRVALSVHLVKDVHRIWVQESEGGLYVSLHCQFEPGESIRQVHEATVMVEQYVRRSVAKVGRVVVHAEPLGAVD